MHSAIDVRKVVNTGYGGIDRSYMHIYSFLASVNHICIQVENKQKSITRLVVWWVKACIVP